MYKKIAIIVLCLGICLCGFKKHDEQFAIKRLLDLQIQRMNLHHAEVVVLENVTSCQPESVYQTIKIKNISKIFLLIEVKYHCFFFRIKK